MALTLNYWCGRGRMEVARMMLAIAGRFPGEGYTDLRHQKPCDNLEMNCGRMPCITVGDEHIGQSIAINTYVAGQTGLNGDNDIEAAKILCIALNIQEMTVSRYKLVPYGSEVTEELIRMWHEDGPSDSIGAATIAQWKSRYLTWWLGRIEASLGPNAGFAVGNKISHADVALFVEFGDQLSEEQASPECPPLRRVPHWSATRTEAALTKHPKIKACIATVANNENIKKWVATRGVQQF